MPTYLNVAALRSAAAFHGDDTPYAIARRSGLSLSTAYRTMTGETSPGVITLTRLAEAYGLALSDLIVPDVEQVAA